MWLINILMIGFIGSILCLLIDLGKRYYGNFRSYVVGSVSSLTLLTLLLIILVNWLEFDRELTFKPNPSILSTLYIIDKFNIFIIFTVLLISLLVSIYSLKYISAKQNSGPFFSLITLLITSIVGVISAGDLLALFLFWEAMSISAYSLVAFTKDYEISLEASLKYLFLAGSGTALALYGIALVYTINGSILLKDLPKILVRDSSLGMFAILILILGFGVEAAIFPLHTWLPDAYSAASIPISSILGGVVTGVGVFVLVKLVQPIIESNLQSLKLILVVLAILTMLTGNLSAYSQRNIKRLLAYSSIAQTGYMLAALSTFSTLGLIAVIFHIWNHGLVKSEFFMLLGSFKKHYEGLEIDKLSGLSKENKVLGFLFGASSLAMVGSPPFGMFWSELLIVQSLLLTSSPMFIILSFIVIANILFSIGYYYKIINSVALGVGKVDKIKIPLNMLIPIVLLFGLSLLTGIFPWIFLNRIS